MDIQKVSNCNKQLPELLKDKLRKMSYEEREELLKILEDPTKRTGVYV